MAPLHAAARALCPCPLPCRCRDALPYSPRCLRRFPQASSLARAAKADGSAVSPKYLTELSTAACSVAELGRFVAANEARFNAFNTVSCLTRLAKLVSKDADLKRRSQRANAAEAEQALVLTRLLEMMVEVRAYSMDVVNLSNAAFALGELKAYATGRGIAAIVDRLATDLEPSASAFLPQSYASSAAAAAPAAAAAQNTSRAPSNGYAGGSTGGGGGRARFGKPYERTLAAAANGYCLASISYPLAQCRVSDARAWDWLALATQSKLLPPGGAGRRGRGAAAAAASPAAPSTITPAQLTNILKAFALAGVRSVELAEAAAPAVLAAAAGPADLAYGAWSLSRMGLTTAGFYAPLAQERLEGSIKVRCSLRR